MRNTGRYRASAQRRRMEDRRRRRRPGGGRNGRKSAGRHIFNGILWTTSMIMILTLLPAESDAAKKLADLTADGNVLAVAARSRILAAILFREIPGRKTDRMRKKMRARSRRKRRVPRRERLKASFSPIIRLKDLRRIRVCRKVRFPVYRQPRTMRLISRVQPCSRPAAGKI